MDLVENWMEFDVVSQIYLIGWYLLRFRPIRKPVNIDDYEYRQSKGIGKSSPNRDHALFFLGVIFFLLHTLNVYVC
jgi:hypothetical protein